MSFCGAAFPEPGPEPALGADVRPKPIVLLVEDEAILAELLSALLARMNLRVLRAGDGATALRLLTEASNPVSLALVDCLLPDMSGCELARELRVRSPHLPLLLMSGRDHRAWVSAFAEGGPTDFLQKPFGPADVSRQVNALLSGRS
jgi:DNA-binding response OmpR family regulator